MWFVYTVSIWRPALHDVITAQSRVTSADFHTFTMVLIRKWTETRRSSGARREEELDLEAARVVSPTNEKITPKAVTHRSQLPRHSLGPKWMSFIDDDTPMSALTIPGTHDSAAFTRSWPFVTTQRMNIRQQLKHGIRYLDFRCGVRNDIVEMVHGPAFLGISLDNVLQTVYQWLGNHPSEALVVQIKQDRKESKSKMHFAQAIFEIISKTSERWRTANTSTTLGELRGRIQLFRRYDGPTLDAYGINVFEWEDNPMKPFTIYTQHGIQLTIQDHYKFPGPTGLPSLVTKKGGDVCELMDTAANDPDPHHWYLNFVSAYEFNIYYQLTPYEVAVGGYWNFKWIEGTNVLLRLYLKEKSGQKRRHGIVAMDYPELATNDLMTALIRSNFDPDDVSEAALSGHLVRTLLLLAMILAGAWILSQIPNCLLGAP